MKDIWEKYLAWRRSGARSRPAAAVRAGLPFTVIMILLQLALSTGLETALITSLIAGTLFAGFGALAWEPRNGSGLDSTPADSE